MQYGDHQEAIIAGAGQDRKRSWDPGLLDNFQGALQTLDPGWAKEWLCYFVSKRRTVT